jgi:hypothetical protein
MDFVKQLEDLKNKMMTKLDELPKEKREQIKANVDIIGEFNKGIKKINKAKNDFINSTK